MTLYSAKVLRKPPGCIAKQTLHALNMVHFRSAGEARLLDYKETARRGGAFDAAACNYVRASVECIGFRLTLYSVC